MQVVGHERGRTAGGGHLLVLDAPDSLAKQSHHNPDGCGIGVFGPDGTPRVVKQPIAAWDDIAFGTAARELTSTTFVAHVRHASTGGHSVVNTHPFEQRGRLFAHNGVVEGLDRLDARLAELGVADLVLGQTDSERVFALLTAEIAAHCDDVDAGVSAAIDWIAEHLPVYSVNFVLTTATDLWALRYPAANELWLLPRRAGGTAGHGALNARTDGIHVGSAALAEEPSVVVASEPMDDDPGWRPLSSGELIHIDADLTAHCRIAFPDPPVHLLTLADLQPDKALSQTAP